MATLEPKASMLRPLDTSGATVITSADLKAVCGDLYDAIALVNQDVKDSLVSLEEYRQLRAMTAAVVATERSRIQFLSVLVGANFELTPLTLEALQEEIVQYLVSPSQTILTSGSTVVDPSVYDVFTANIEYEGNTPVSWGNEVTTVIGRGETFLLWWNGRNFLKVDSTPTDKADRSAVKPGDVFTAGDITDFRIRNADELARYLTGDDAAWGAAGAGATFDIKPLTGNQDSVFYSWSAGKFHPEASEAVPGGSNFPLPTDWLNHAQVLEWVDKHVLGAQARAEYAMIRHQEAGGNDAELMAALMEIWNTPVVLTTPGYDPAWTIQQIRDWVDVIEGDGQVSRDRAVVALYQEQLREAPRTTLVPWLEAIIDEETTDD